MAFVFKRPGSKCWYAGFTAANGEQKKVSTKLRHALVDKKTAKAFAQKLEDAAHLEAKGTLTESRARMFLSEMVERATGARMAFHSVAAWIETWLEGKKASKERSTFLSYQKVVTDFLAHLGPERAARSMELVTVRDFQSFRDKQVREGKTPQTANDLLKKLRIPFTLARRQGIIPTNPAEAIETLPFAQIVRSTFTLDQLTALVNSAEDEWRGVILAGIYTGQRLRDITNLRWEAVDLPARTVGFVQIKTKRRVLMPIHEALENWLLSRSAPDTGKSFVFASLAGRPTGGAHGLSRRFKSVMDKAAIRPERARARNAVKGTKGRDLYALSFHSLRHTFNSIMANAGIAQEIRQELTGHASAEMNRVYTHHELTNLRTAVDTLPMITPR